MSVYKLYSKILYTKIEIENFLHSWNMGINRSFPTSQQVIDIYIYRFYGEQKHTHSVKRQNILCSHHNSVHGDKQRKNRNPYTVLSIFSNMRMYDGVVYEF